LSFIKEQQAEMVRRFGSPDSLTFTQQMTPVEMGIVRRSMKDGRAPDLTLYIKKDDGYIFIAKPFYPKGLFRAPSGGVWLGEDFEEGAKREAVEETGTAIELEKYLLRIDVRFQCDGDIIDWTSHIFSADYVKGEINPVDNHEIKEARLVYPSEIPGFIDIMRKSNSGGLVYRAFLTTEVGKRLGH